MRTDRELDDGFDHLAHRAGAADQGVAPVESELGNDAAGQATGPAGVGTGRVDNIVYPIGVAAQARGQ